MKVPILKLHGILLASIQIELTDDEAMLFQHDLTHEVTHTEAKGVVIDITAMEIVDTFMARILNQTARMVRLLGAKCIVCGVRPQIAMTLVEMGLEMLQVETALNLEQAFDRLNVLIRKHEEREHAGA